MSPDRRHDAWLKFVKSILDIPLGRSREELLAYLDLAYIEHPSLVPIIKAYIEMSERSVTNFVSYDSEKRSNRTKQRHLFDLLREETFFPRALDLAIFASKLFPEIPSNRFAKISREEIAARIIVYIESKGPKARLELEKSMRNALSEITNKPHPELERESFLTKWERIIKG